MRGMILAAGFGTRLRPLTLARPKPLLPLANRPQLHYQLDLLRRAGVRNVVINVHHLSHAIPEFFKNGSALGMALSYSVEREILGTGGGIKACAKFLTTDPGPFVVINGDTLIDLDLEEVIQVHRRAGAMATMVLREDPRAETFGAIGVDESDRIVDFVGRAHAPGRVVRRGLFTGVHIMSPEVLERIPEGPCGINETAYPVMVREGARVQACFQQGYWSDVGTPRRYLEANLAILSGAFHPRGQDLFKEAGWAVDRSGRTHGSEDRVHLGPLVQIVPPVLLGAGATIEAGVRLGPEVVIGERTAVGPGVRLAHTVVWADCRIPQARRLEKAIVWHDGARTRTLTLSDTA